MSKLPPACRQDWGWWCPLPLLFWGSVLQAVFWEKQIIYLAESAKERLRSQMQTWGSAAWPKGADMEPVVSHRLPSAWPECQVLLACGLTGPCRDKGHPCRSSCSGSESELWVNGKRDQGSPHVPPGVHPLTPCQAARPVHRHPERCSPLNRGGSYSRAVMRAQVLSSHGDTTIILVSMCSSNSLSHFPAGGPGGPLSAMACLQSELLRGQRQEG